MAFVEEVVVSKLVVQYNSRSPQLELHLKFPHTLLRKKLPEIFISSHLTTTIFCPERICLEMIEANRPRRCPLPSMTMGVEEKVAIVVICTS